MQGELARVERGHVAAPEKRANKTAFGGSDTLELVRPIAPFLARAGYPSVEIGRHLRQVFSSPLHLGHLVILLAEGGEYRLQLLHGLGGELTLYCRIEILLAHGRA